MIKLTQGNLLNAPVEALVNTVNTVGVMGKGIALQFKLAYPEMFIAYVQACKTGKLNLGKMHVFDMGGLVGGPRWIINFPTKGHWRSPSKIDDIESGLKDLSNTIRRLNIKSIALPPLGCGNGGLNWVEVNPLIESVLGNIQNLEVLVFPPGESPVAVNMPNRTLRPKMTVGRAALISLMDRYLKGLLDPFVNLLEIHKLMYFLQAAGHPLNLQYEPHHYGPYAKNLRQVLIHLESHYTKGYGDGSDSPGKIIELLPGAVDEAKSFLQKTEFEKVRQYMEQVTELIEGYEDPIGLELLSSVHWVLSNNEEARSSAEVTTSAVQAWNTRKGNTFNSEQIIKARERLLNKGWCSKVPSV